MKEMQKWSPRADGRRREMKIINFNWFCNKRSMQKWSPRTAGRRREVNIIDFNRFCNKKSIQKRSPRIAGRRREVNINDFNWFCKKKSIQNLGILWELDAGRRHVEIQTVVFHWFYCKFAHGHLLTWCLVKKMLKKHLFYIAKELQQQTTRFGGLIVSLWNNNMFMFYYFFNAYKKVIGFIERFGIIKKPRCLKVSNNNIS